MLIKFVLLIYLINNFFSFNHSGEKREEDDDESFNRTSHVHLSITFLSFGDTEM